MSGRKNEQVSKERHPTAGAPGFQDKQQGGLRIGFVVVVALIAFVSGGIITMAVTGPSKGTPAATQAPVSAALPTPTASTTPTAPGTVPLGAADGSFPSSAIPSTSNPNIPNPQPWQYDPVADKHYDPSPGHQHWHPGQPRGQTADEAIIARPGMSNPNIPNPEPWQYDPVANKHYVPTPGHQHWHSGQPPPPDQRQ
jgi:hypothetical protein